RRERARRRGWSLPIIEPWRRSHPFAEIVPISAMDGTYCDQLLGLIVRRLPEHPPFFPPDATSDQPETFYVGEMIREKMCNLTHQEGPHAVGGRVEDRRERES